MDNETVKAKINDVLSSDKKTAQWASWNGLKFEAAKILLKSLSEQPEVSAAAEKYIWEQSDTSTKSYVAGEEKGYKRGHGVGFGKGVALATLLGVAVLATAATRGAIDFTKLVITIV